MRSLSPCARRADEYQFAEGCLDIVHLFAAIHMLIEALLRRFRDCDCEYRSVLTETGRTSPRSRDPWEGESSV